MTSDRDKEIFYQAGGPLSRGGWTHIYVRRWLVFGLTLLVLSIGAWLNLEETSRVASYSNDVRLLEEQKQRLRLEISGLNAEIAQASALADIEAYAEANGYTLTSANDASVVEIVVEEIAESSVSSSSVTDTPSTNSDVAESSLFSRLLQYLGWVAEPPDSEE